MFSEKGLVLGRSQKRVLHLGRFNRILKYTTIGCKMKKFYILLFEKKRHKATLCYLLLLCLDILIKFADSTLVLLFSVFVRILKRYDGSEIFFDRGREEPYFPTLLDSDSHLIFIQLGGHLHTDHELVFTSIFLSLLFTFALILMTRSTV